MHVTVAGTRAERMRGLLGLPEMPSGRALLIPNCRAVHTMGMRFPIDVAFLDASGRVIEVVTMRPGRLGWPRRRARHVLECEAGRSPAVGSRVKWYQEDAG